MISLVNWRHWVWWLWLAFVHIALVGLALTSSQIRSYCKSSGICSHVDITQHYRSKRAFLRQRVRQIQGDFALVIGDSYIEGLAFEMVDSFSFNAGIGGDTTIGVLERLPDYEPLEQWRYIVLLIGFNDLKHRVPVEVARNIRAILDLLGRNSSVHVIGLIPIDETVVSDYRIGSNEQITELNNLVSEIASKFENVAYIDLSTSFVDSDGRLLSRLYVGDGVHLNSVGQKIAICRFRKTLVGDIVFMPDILDDC